MNDTIYDAFFGRQLAESLALAASSDVLKLVPLGGNPPQQYIAEFSCKGLVRDRQGQIREFGKFTVGIWFPEDYLRRVVPGQTVSYIGPAPEPWHPNIRPPFVCLRIKPGTPLVDILYTCFDLWTWNLFYTGDEGLNHAAAQWARQQDKSRFPVDRRPLKRRTLKLAVDSQPKEGRTHV